MSALEPVPRPPVHVTAETLAHIGVQANDPLASLTVLLAERYGLDPLLKHLEVIATQHGRKLYITRDGYLDIAHRSGHLDGIVVEDVSRGESGWRATVSVWRKDMRYPFTFSAGCGDAEEKPDPEAMAIARAERRALRRAFTVVQAIEYRHGLTDDDGDRAPLEPMRPVDDPVAVAQLAEPRGPRWHASTADQRDAHKAVAALPSDQQIAFMEQYEIPRFSGPWPDIAVADVLGFGPAPAQRDVLDTGDTPTPAPTDDGGGS